MDNFNYVPYKLVRICNQNKDNRFVLVRKTKKKKQNGVREECLTSHCQLMAFWKEIVLNYIDSGFKLF